MVERRKFGPQGWNRSYPYNTGDLTISVDVLYNYLEANAKVSNPPSLPLSCSLAASCDCHMSRYPGPTCVTCLARSCTVDISPTTGTGDSAGLTSRSL